MHILERLQAEGWDNPKTGQREALPIQEIQIIDGLKEHMDAIMAGWPDWQSVAVVVDPRTYDALGRQVIEALSSKKTMLMHLDNPVASIEEATRIKDASTLADVLVAVGSGTINDLCKWAAHQHNKPYVAFPTALSMNGYCSATASLWVKNHKQTLPASAPYGVYGDIHVWANAPLRLTRSGVGDVLCRSTCEVDWRLSHHLLGTWFSEQPFAWLKAIEPAYVEALPGLTKGDKASYRVFGEYLLLSSLGMLYAQGSYPASQGEHLLAHTLEAMKGQATGWLHGEEIGVLTLYMSLLQAQWLEKETLPALVFTSALVTQAATALESYGLQLDQNKVQMLQQVEATLPMIQDKWDAIRQDLQKRLVPATLLQSQLQVVGALYQLESLAIEANLWKKLCRYAPLTRNRLTFLDMQFLFDFP